MESVELARWGCGSLDGVGDVDEEALAEGDVAVVVDGGGDAGVGRVGDGGDVGLGGVVEGDVGPCSLIWVTTTR